MSFTLRCHRCSHAVGRVSSEMRLVALFKSSLAVRIATALEGEVRKRCNSCGWVNVFYPPEQRQVIELKSSARLSASGAVRSGPSMATHQPLLRSGHA